MANHWSPKPGLGVQLLPLPLKSGMKDKILGYLKETLSEMKKVVWPDRRYVSVATLIILVLVVLTGLFLMVTDYGLTVIFKALLK